MRIAELRRQGTTTVEIKSGYGLTVVDEQRALRLAAGMSAETTFLGAHVVPADERQVFAEPLAVHVEQPMAVAVLDTAEAAELGRGGRVGGPQPLREVVVDAGVLLLQRDRQGEQLALGQGDGGGAVGHGRGSTGTRCHSTRVTVMSLRIWLNSRVPSR